jgi:hypothetical protein
MSNQQTVKTAAYHEGYQAYRIQKGSESFPMQGENPYSENSSDYWDWAKGWNDQCRDDDEDESHQESYGY